MELIEIGDGFQYPIISTGKGRIQPYRIIGSTCAGTDVIADNIPLPKLKVDLRDQNKSSRIYLLNTGAYSLEYVMKDGRNGFNGLTIPQVHYRKNGEIMSVE